MRLYIVRVSDIFLKGAGSFITKALTCFILFNFCTIKPVFSQNFNKISICDTRNAFFDHVEVPYNGKAAIDMLLPNIHSSENEMEFRLYEPKLRDISKGAVYILSINHNKIKRYRLRYLNDEQPIRTKGFKLIKKISDKNFLSGITDTATLLIDGCTLLKKLDQERFFTLNDESYILNKGKKKLTREKDPSLDAGGQYFFEIKVRNDFRTFNYSIGMNPLYKKDDRENLLHLITIFKYEK